MEKKTDKPSQVYVVKSTSEVPAPSMPMNVVQPVLPQEKDANSQGTNKAQSLDSAAENLEVLKVGRQDSSKPTASSSTPTASASHDTTNATASASHDSNATNSLKESLGPSHATTHTTKASDIAKGIQLHANSVENKSPPSEMLLRPIIYDKNSPKLAKQRFLKNMGRSSDTESNKARVEKEHQGYYENLDNNDEDDSAFYTEDDDNSDEQVPFNEEEPAFIPVSHRRKGKNKSQNTASIGVQTRTTRVHSGYENRVQEEL